MTENNGQTTPQLGADETGEDVPLETWVKDVELQIRRLRSKAAQAAGDGDGGPTVADVLNELHANVLPLVKDLGAYVERLEDHAEWASEELGNLSDAVHGTDENASQLAPVDAERIKVFLLAIAHGADEMLTRPEGAPASEGSPDYKRLQQWSHEAVELVRVIEDITIDTSDESSSDDQTRGDESGASTEGGQAEA